MYMAPNPSSTPCTNARSSVWAHFALHLGHASCILNPRAKAPFAAGKPAVGTAPALPQLMPYHCHAKPQAHATLFWVAMKQRELPCAQLPICARLRGAEAAADMSGADPAPLDHSNHSWQAPRVSAGMATRPRVVVVGAGFAGLAAARELSKTHAYEVTVVDPKE